MGRYESCSYSNIDVAVYDEKPMNHIFKPLFWKHFHDDLIALWIYSNEDANHCLNYLNFKIIIFRFDLLCKLKIKMALNI